MIAHKTVRHRFPPFGQVNVKATAGSQPPGPTVAVGAERMAQVTPHSTHASE